MFKLTSCFKSSQPSYSTGINLFDHVVKPVLTYASDIWGCDRIKKNNSFFNWMMNDPLEKCHLKYLRYILGVNKHAPKLAIYGDSGRFPLAIDSLISSIKYLHRLLNMSADENPLLYETFRENQNLCITTSWFHKIKTFLSRLGVDLNLIQNQNIKKSVQYVKSYLRNIFIVEWKAELFNDNRKRKHGNKLRCYRQFKTTFHTESYLLECHNRMHRQYFAKLRLSAHKLHIETGRYCNSNRLSPFYNDMYIL